MHFSVMADESLALLAVRPDGIYLDATTGLGGHTALIAARLVSGFVIANDRDAHGEGRERLVGAQGMHHAFHALRLEVHQRHAQAVVEQRGPARRIGGGGAKQMAHLQLGDYLLLVAAQPQAAAGLSGLPPS